MISIKKTWLFCFWVFLTLGATSDLGAADRSLVINECMALNGSTVTDPQGEYEDWIEIANLTTQALDLGGLYLSDDPSDPTQWQFPLGTTIAPSGYVVIWADNDMDDSGLHANFQLDSEGETLWLFDRDALSIIDTLTYTHMPLDTSFGYEPGNGQTPLYLRQPTPGRENSDAYLGVVANPRFSHDHGFYDQSFNLTLACDTADASIRYTLNGKIPTAGSARYTAPLTISSTTCLRMIAIQDGWKSSGVMTRSYLFVKDIKNQSSDGEPSASQWPTGPIDNHVIDYGMDPEVVNDPLYSNLIEDSLLALPSFSLVTDLDHLFDPQTGMYVNPEDTRADSAAWERPVSIELMNPDGTPGFQIDAGFRLRGGASRKDSNPKHAFRVYFRTSYGQAKLKYPLFEEEGVDEFDKFDLRTSQNYSWSYNGSSNNTMVREVFSRDLQGEMGHPYTRSRYYHLYINGQYWGVYQTQERVEASFAESYLGGDKEDYDAIKSDWTVNRGMLATDGNMDAYRQLYDMTLEGFGDHSRYLQAQGLNPDGSNNPDFPKLLDIDNLIDLMIIDYFTGDRDGPGSRYGNKPNNIFMLYNRVNPDGFKWFQHDSEHSLGTGVDNLVIPFTTAGAQWQFFNPHWLHEQIIQNNPNYRMQFADRVYQHFKSGGLLSPSANINRINRRAQEIELAMVAESARWGDAKSTTPKTRDGDWRPAIDNLINNYLPPRTNTVLDQFKAVGWYPPIDPPELGTVPDEGSRILILSAPEDIYYTLDGTDPRLPELSDVEISGTALVLAGHTKRVWVPTGNIGDAWKDDLGFNDSAWIQTTGTPGGIGYETGSGYEDRLSLDTKTMMRGQQTSCYVRITFDINESPDRYDALSLKMQYDDGFVAYLNGHEVHREGFAGTPAWNSAANGNHEADTTEAFDITSALSYLQSGANLLAIHGLNVSLTSSDFIILPELVAQKVHHNDDDSGGVADTATLYTGPVELTENTPIKARVYSGITWSALTQETVVIGSLDAGLCITEIMYHPEEGLHSHDPNTEFIELANLSDKPINVKDVRFSEGVTFVFPSRTLAARESIVVVRDIVAFQTQYGTKVSIVGPYEGKLSNNGEQLTLLNPNGQIIQTFTYQDYWYSNTDGEGYSLTRSDPEDTSADLSSDAAWRPSLLKNGSPGIVD